MKKYFVLFLFISILFNGCGVIEEGIHFAQDKITELRIGAPQVAPRLSDEGYAYGLLTPDEQILYDQIYSCILRHEERIPISCDNEKTLIRVYDHMVADHGEIFWVNGYRYEVYNSGDYVTGMVFSPEYTHSLEERKALENEVEKVVSQWLSGVSPNFDDYTKSKYVFEKIINEVDYSRESENNQNILSVFLDKQSVCQGFACAVQLLLNRLGIQSTVITGTANNESHAWNLVLLDGDYYYMDSTWGNSTYQNSGETGKMIDYSYLNITTEELLINHEISPDIKVPVCAGLWDNYFIREGKYFQYWDEAAVGEVISRTYSSEKPFLSLKFGSREAYDMALDHLITQRQFARYCPGAISISYLVSQEKLVLTLRFTQ